MKKYWLGALMAIALLIGGGKFAYDYFFFDLQKRDEILQERLKPTKPATPLVKATEFPASSPAKPTAEEVQAALENLGIPTGKVDGKWGQRTRQGFCIWRELTGRNADRNYPIEIEQYAIVNTKQLLIPKEFIVGLNISKTCQSAVWVKDKARSKYKVTIASTGMPGLETDSGYFKVGWNVDRWYESIAYPDGWMYRPQFFNRGQAVHGSEYDAWVWWYPASHGCVRMLGGDIDELWASGFGVGSKVYVYGTWNPYTNDPKEI